MQVASGQLKVVSYGRSLSPSAILAAKIPRKKENDCIRIAARVYTMSEGLYFYETVTGMTADKALEFVTALKELTGKGVAVIYLSTNLHTKEVTTKGNAFGPCPLWFEQVERLGKNIEKKQEE